MTATDKFGSRAAGMESSAANAFAITPHDTNELTFVTRGIYVGGSGDVKADLVNGDTVTFVGLAAGIIHPIRARLVYSTGTDATDIIGVY